MFAIAIIVLVVLIVLGALKGKATALPPGKVTVTPLPPGKVGAPLRRQLFSQQVFQPTKPGEVGVILGTVATKRADKLTDAPASATSEGIIKIGSALVTREAISLAQAATVYLVGDTLVTTVPGVTPPAGGVAIGRPGSPEVMDARKKLGFR